MSFSKVHPDFQLNGIPFTEEILKDTAYSFIKEGEPYEMAIGNFLCDWLDNSSTIAVQTSGSTGTPKRILLQKQQMMNSALATGEFFELRPGSSALLCLSADYIAGKMMLVRAMVLGLHLDSVAPVSNPLEGIDTAYDFGAMVPMQLQNSIKHSDRINTLLVGGAPLPLGLKEELKQAASHIFETYGMTETITHVALKEIGSSFNLGRESEMFKALPNVTFAIDTRSCLVIDAPKVSDQRIVTNDMVQLISETEFEWLGRYDNAINSGGVKLHPEQIEKKLSGIIGERFFVAGLEDFVLGEKLVLIVEGKVDATAILHTIKVNKLLEPFEMPKDIFTLSQFTMTDNGKIRRKETLKLL